MSQFPEEWAQYDWIHFQIANDDEVGSFCPFVLFEVVKVGKCLIFSNGEFEVDINFLDAFNGVLKQFGFHVVHLWCIKPRFDHRIAIKCFLSVPRFPREGIDDSNCYSFDLTVPVQKMHLSVSLRFDPKAFKDHLLGEFKC